MSKECDGHLFRVAGVFAALVLSGCQSGQSQEHHVLIAYPKQWNDGDRRPCFLGPEGGATVSRAMGQPDLPQLDCDRFVQGELIHKTPPERVFALDVVFTADFAKALESRRRFVNNETTWTCQRNGDIIRCSP